MIDELAIKAVFERSLKLKKDESCLIITDELKESLARPFFDFASRICSDCHIEIMKPLEMDGQEPLPNIADMILRYDVELLITSKSLTHTKARRDATSKGARIASMPNITEDTANRCLDVDYEGIKERSLKLCNILSKANNIRITTEKGTNIIIERGKNKVFYNDGGVFDYKGAIGNLPEGEVEFSPSNANGVYVVDASFPTFGKLNSPLRFEVSDGRVTKITGERSDELVSTLDKIGPNTYIVAELGIGTHPKAKITGNILEDEKVLGTCHIAIGNNLSYGGSNDVPVHLDGVITKPTIHIDEKKIMEDGNPLF